MDPLDLTFDLLATSENEAATGLLIAALGHRSRAVSDRALQAVLRRQSPAALDELVRRWHLGGERWKHAVAQRPGVLTASLRAAFVSSDEQLIHNAANAAVALADYDLGAMLAQATADSSPLRRRLAADAVLRLAEMLYEELHGEERTTARHDPQCVREFLVGSLEIPASRFDQHGAREVLEAFLLLARRESATLRHLLQDHHEPAHDPLCEQLLRSTRPGVVRLLLSFIDDPHAPLAALRILGRRRDVGFLRQLCLKLIDDHSTHVDKNLARIDELGWVDDNLAILASLAEGEQPGAALLVARSKLPLSEKQRVLKQLLDQGQPQGRQAAAQALFEIYEGQCDWLVADLIHDPCPLVQAEAVRRLRSCDMPDAVQMLIDLLDSPHEEVQAAARDSLTEFRFPRFLAGFDSLSDEARQSTGELMLRVDPQASADLDAELIAPGRARRLRALQIADVLGLASQLESTLVEVSLDENQVVRLEAERLLGECTGPAAQRALRDLLNDSNTAVQREAEQALAGLAEASL